MMYVTKQVHFCAAHKLYNPNWSKEKNLEIFGPCANENWHGHNFEMHVTVKGKVDPDTGFVINFKVLKKILHEEILSKVDHKNLDIDVEFMKGKLSSCENMVSSFWDILYPKIKEATLNKASLHAIRLYETGTSYAEYFGPDAT